MKDINRFKACGNIVNSSGTVQPNDTIQNFRIRLVISYLSNIASSLIGNKMTLVQPCQELNTRGPWATSLTKFYFIACAISILNF